MVVLDGAVGYTQSREQGDELPVEETRQAARVLDHLQEEGQRRDERVGVRGKA